MEVFAAIAPEGLSPVAAWFIIAASALTAGLTAAFGLGGGLVLLAIMSALMPAPAVIPVHGVAQLGANASRFALHFKSTAWRPFIWFIGGAAIGAFLGGQLVVTLPAWLLRGAVGAFVLYSQWGRMPSFAGLEARAFAVVGVVGTFLTMFFGATGPFVASAVSALKVDRLVYTATHAACMVAQHGLKVAAFAAVGFAFHDWAVMIVLIVASGFVGTLIGSRILKRSSDARFKRVFKWLVTALGANLIVQSAYVFVQTLL